MELDQGALFIGSPETVARKIATMVRDLRLRRFDLKYDILHLPRDVRARTIELFGREVAPRVRETPGRRTGPYLTPKRHWNRR
jgi:alkanesulfonate monooxygenase SsuD/methylene tetrahydromethanopterin reductase-like flavin-dependent oxidoreductase (luciferase family)